MRETVELILVPLSEQLAKADQRYQAERARAIQAGQRVDRLHEQLSDAPAAERIARDEAAGLRAELEARRAR